MFKPGTHPEVSFDMKFVKCFLKTSCCENIGQSVQFWNVYRWQSQTKYNDKGYLVNILSTCGGNFKSSLKPKLEVPSKQNLFHFITIIMTAYSSEVVILGREMKGLWFQWLKLTKISLNWFCFVDIFQGNVLFIYLLKM